ncbi:hypothetical protein [Paenibacillus sp. Z6-24]
MKVVPFVNKEGYFVKDVLEDQSFVGTVLLEDGSGTIIAEPVLAGLYKPRWDFEGKQWVEGLSAEEIEKIKNSMPAPEASETVEKKLTRLEQADLDNKELIASLYEMLLSREK